MLIYLLKIQAHAKRLQKIIYFLNFSAPNSLHSKISSPSSCWLVLSPVCASLLQIIILQIAWYPFLMLCLKLLIKYSSLTEPSYFMNISPTASLKSHFDILLLHWMLCLEANLTSLLYLNSSFLNFLISSLIHFLYQLFSA